MPQDSFRSFVYRSFVTCDDPKGVVEYGTSKKPKTRISKTEDKSQIAETNETDSVEDLDTDSPSSLQLLEVSREAQKLNRAIDSWSSTNGLSLDGHSAKSLLRGAIDLQESRVMLGKLQEASQYVSKVMKGREKVDEARSESRTRINSDRFGDELYDHKEFQESKRPGEGSSSDSINELKRVVRDSFAKQILLPDSRKEEKAFYETRKLGSPCTSSSQSSEMYSKDKSKEGTVEYNATDRKDSSIFDNRNYPRHKKSHLFADGHPNDSCEELRRVIRHGLAERNHPPNLTNDRKSYHDCGRFDSGSEVPSTSSSNLTSTASSSSSAALEKAKFPSLIAKLMGLDEFPLKQTQPTSLMSNPRRSTFDVEMPKTINHLFVAPKTDPERRTLRDVLEANHFKGRLKSKPVNVLEKVIDDMPPIVIMKSSHFSSVDPEKVRFVDSLVTSGVPRKLKGKEERIPTGTGCRKRFLNAKEKCINQESLQEKPIKSISQPNKSAGSRFAGRPEDGKAKSKQEISRKSKPLIVPVTIKLRKDGVSDKKAPNATQVAKKSPELNARSKSPLKSAGKANVTLAKTSKHAITDLTKQIKNHSSTNPKTKQVKKGPPNMGAIASNFVAEDNDSKMNLACVVELVKNIETTTTTIANQLHVKEDQETPYTEYEERCHDDESHLSEVATPTNHHENITLCSKEGKDRKYIINAESKSISNMERILKEMLVNSPSFTNRANKLLDLSMDRHHRHPGISHSSSVNGVEEAGSSLFLDCANELLERRIHQVSEPHTLSLPKHFSLDELVNEVYEEVEILRSYANLGSGNFHKDGILSMLDHDLKCKDRLSSIWEFAGWKTGFSGGEVEQVGLEIEETVLEELIDEAFTNHGA